MHLQRFLPFLFLFFFLFPVSTDAASLYRNLTLGDTGEDVRILQQILNSRPETLVSTAGAGSPDQETTYFGVMTRASVIKYQERFAAEVLAPLGLTKGTGYVGTLTRAHMGGTSISVSGGDKTADAIAALDQAISGSTGNFSRPRIASISPARGSSKTEVTIYGEGFLPTGNIVISAFEEVRDVPSPDGKTLMFHFNGPFPEDFMEENEKFYRDFRIDMEYQVVVRNTSGVSNFMPFLFTFYE